MLFRSQQVDTEIKILETECDMSTGASLNTSTFSVYFHFDINTQKLDIQEGDLIRADIAGMEQRGRIIGIYPSQLGGCTVLLDRI